MAVGEENTVVNTHLSLFLELLSIFTSIKSQENLTRLEINTNNIYPPTDFGHTFYIS